MPDQELLAQHLALAERHMAMYQRINGLLRSRPPTPESRESLRLNEDLIRIADADIKRLRTGLGIRRAVPE